MHYPRYAPHAGLPHLPSAPRGFQLRLYTDGTAYVLSIKDSLDACKYAIFRMKVDWSTK